MLEEEDVLIVPGTSFNVPYRDHFRVTCCPEAPMLREVFTRIDRVLARARKASAAARWPEDGLDARKGVREPFRGIPIQRQRAERNVL